MDGIAGRPGLPGSKGIKGNKGQSGMAGPQGYKGRKGMLKRPPLSLIIPEPGIQGEMGKYSKTFILTLHNIKSY
jgi:hypothetical protein